MIEHPHIQMRDGVAYVENTRVPVARLFWWHKKGVTVDTLLKRYPTLKPAEMLSALAFAYDNLNLMEAAIETERRLLGT